MTDVKLHELVFQKPVPPEDSRSFLVRLLASLRFRVVFKRSKGWLVPSLHVKGGADF